MLALVIISIGAACTSAGPGVDNASTVVPSSIASGTGERGAAAIDCGEHELYAGDTEFQVAVCEVELAIADADAPNQQWESRLAAAIVGYSSDRDAALDELFAISEEIAEADEQG